MFSEAHPAKLSEGNLTADTVNVRDELCRVPRPQAL